jgi:hypothetical protein
LSIRAERDKSELNVSQIEEILLRSSEEKPNIVNVIRRFCFQSKLRLIFTFHSLLENLPSVRSEER